MPVSYLGNQGILNGLSVGDGFFHRLGATVTERTYCDSGACTAYASTIGATAGVDPESLVHSRYIILWATNTISTNLHLWPIIAEAQKNGAKVVCIDPMRHRTAQRADWHIPIRPGTDGALALALMNVIISEGLTDEDYVANYTHGYDELVERVQPVHPRVGVAGDRDPGRRHPHAGPRVRDHRPVDDPDRGRGGAARRRRPDRALDRLPARARRGVAARRRRVAAVAAVGAPGELARVHAPGAPHARHPRREPVLARPGADRRTAARSADHGARGLQLQPDGGLPRTGQAPARAGARRPLHRGQ